MNVFHDLGVPADQGKILTASYTTTTSKKSSDYNPTQESCPVKPKGLDSPDIIRNDGEMKMITDAEIDEFIDNFYEKLLTIPRVTGPAMRVQREPDGTATVEIRFTLESPA